MESANSQLRAAIGVRNHIEEEVWADTGIPTPVDRTAIYIAHLETLMLDQKWKGKLSKWRAVCIAMRELERVTSR
jgi:hypothetical protein